MATEFCTGYAAEPFKSLVESYPGTAAYPADKFRVEWGPIFHRGRLDGSARVLAIGQDPAEHEDIARRILVGAAGQRVQGFLAKLGITRSYVIINTYLYSVASGNPGSSSINDPKITAYRNAWLDAIFATSGSPRKIEGVVTFGGLAEQAWNKWATTQPAAKLAGLAVAHVKHPTYPAHFTGTARAQKTAELLADWNAGLTTLRAGLQHTDVPMPATKYGTTFKASELVQIPEIDLPAGLPAWMRDCTEAWANRSGKSKIIITIPSNAAVEPSAAPEAVNVRAMAMRGVEGEVEIVEARAAKPAARRTGLCALRGTVATMVAGAQPLKDHVVYIRDGLIAAVQRTGEGAPQGFEGVTVRATGGFIFPGFIELHNHMAFNVLPMWSVPKKFEHRGQWRDHPDYKMLITGPMKTIAGTEDLMAAVCRYSECKALFGGTTTSQGITLASAGGKLRKHFKGLVRNCESTDDPDLNPAGGTIADADAKQIEKFYSTLKKEDSCYLLHLAEGIPAAAHKHFEALKRTGKTPRFALTRNFCGIHSTGLTPADFAVMAEFGASMVWSPLSNLLLYGDTANVRAAKDAGVTIGLGADWSPSGSKSILGEFKVAKAWSDLNGGIFTDEEIIAMATRNAAAILKWQRVTGRAGAGTIEVGNIADLTVVKGAGADPYKALLKARETDIRLVMIGGGPRFGVKELVEPLTNGDSLETVSVGGSSRRLNLHPANKVANSGTPELDDISLAEAAQRLKIAFANLPELHAAAPAMAAMAAAAPRERGPGRERWTLALDEIEDTGLEMRSLMGLPGRNKSSLTKLPDVAVRAQDVELRPVRLDPLTVADDDQWVKGLGKSKNLPQGMKNALKAAYS